MVKLEWKMNLREPRFVCLRICAFEDKIGFKIDYHVRVYETYNIPLMAVAIIVKDALEDLNTLDVNQIQSYVHNVLLSFGIEYRYVDVEILEPREMKELDKK